MPQLDQSVSVLIAAYNAASFLEDAVQSAVTQSIRPLEIIIVDDKSNDDTLNVARRLRQLDDRIRIIALDENAGPAKARNIGIDVAHGDWIALLDADDRFTSDHLETLLKGSAQADVIGANFDYFSAQEHKLFPSNIFVSSPYEKIDMRRYIEHARPYTDQADWGLLKPLVRRAFLNDHKLRYREDSRHGEDFLFIMDCFKRGGIFVLSLAPTYLYTDRFSGFSRTRIDYKTMSRHTSELASPKNGLDASVRRALHDRAKAINRLSIERDFDFLRKSRAHLELIRKITTHPSFALESLRRVRRSSKRRSSDLRQRLDPLWKLFCLSLRWRLKRDGLVHGLDRKLVVSLTSFPSRFSTLAHTLKCLLTQSIRADHVILWIADKDYELLPQDILRLQADGLEIKKTDDTRSYKKIIPALDFDPDAYICTADDDVYYSRDWLKVLIEGLEGRAIVTCHRAHKIKADNQNIYAPYMTWERGTRFRGKSLALFPTGVGGVLYFPGALLHSQEDKVAAFEFCPNADDIWLYWLARRNGATFKTVGRAKDPVLWNGSQMTALWKTNAIENGNDESIKRMGKKYGYPKIK